MINWLANLSNRIAVFCVISFSLAACGGGGGGGGGGGFIPDEDNETTPLSFVTTSLPEASENADYTALLEATGGKKPYSWAILDDGGTGFTVNNEGFITGLAPEKGEYGLTLEVADSSNKTDKLSVILTVGVGPDSLAIATTALPSGIDGVPYTALIQANGGEQPYTWAVVDDGDTGFTINNEGFLTGTSPGAGDYGLTRQVTDGNASLAKTSFILTVTGDLPQPLAIATESLPAGEEGKGYLALLEANGGEGDYLWTMVSAGGSGLQVRDDGVLSGTAPAEGQYPITVSVTDDTDDVETSILVLLVTAQSSPLTITTSSLPGGTVKERYAAILEASGGDKPYTWTLLSSGGQAGLSLSAAGVLAGTPTVPGVFGLVFQVSDGTSTDQKAITLTINAEDGGSIPLKITTSTLPPASRVLYAAAVEATGGIKPYSWSGGDTSSPGTGFTVNASSGSITGNTNDLLPGQYGYRVTVADGAGETDTRSYVITVPGGDSPPVRILTENPLPTAFEGQFYSTILRAVGGSGDTAWSVIDAVGFPGAPPSFANAADIESGVLTWPSAAIVEGNYLITIQVNDTKDGTSDVVTYDLQASASSVRITTDSLLPGGVVGTAYSTIISAEGGGGSETWSVASVTPDTGGPVFTGAGITNGTLTWATPVAGAYTVSIKVVSEDGSGFASEDDKVFSLDIVPTP